MKILLYSIFYLIFPCLKFASNRLLAVFELLPCVYRILGTISWCIFLMPFYFYTILIYILDIFLFLRIFDVLSDVFFCKNNKVHSIKINAIKWLVFCLLCIRLRYITSITTTTMPSKSQKKRCSLLTKIITLLLLSSFDVGLICFNFFSNEYNQSMRHIWSLLLHNLWNVFIRSKKYVDVWSLYSYSNSVESVSWSMSTSTASERRASRTSTFHIEHWRPFLYLSNIQTEEDSNALWSYLCYKCNMLLYPITKNGTNPKELLPYKFYMLQADVVPNLAFSPTRKRLIQSYHCKRKDKKNLSR